MVSEAASSFSIYSSLNSLPEQQIYKQTHGFNTNRQKLQVCKMKVFQFKNDNLA